MSSFRPLRRRRFGLCNTRTLVTGLCLLILFGTFVKLRVRRLDPALDLEQDISNANGDHPNRGQAVQPVQSVDDLLDKPTKQDNGKGDKSGPSGGQKRNAFVVASQQTENTTWLDHFFPTWEKFIYHVDDSSAKLTVPKNKGRESMVYLTYIIDHYEDLPDNVFFIHPTRFQWHNDDPDYDGLRMLRNFQLPYLAEEGYVNMRCAWVLGCPAEIRPFEQEDHHRTDVHAGEHYKKAFVELFPDKDIPEVVGASCCAQFATTRDRILKNPKSDYEHYRQWLMNTKLEDAISGRVLEYSWHMIFGKKPVHCPDAKECYCRVFGACNLECKPDSCEGRYILPPSSSLPDGWPAIGWQGEPRKYTTTDL